MNKIYEDADIWIERENSPIPWIKIFTKEPFRELSDCPAPLRHKLFETAMTAERAMRDYFRPTKINHASFGNYVARVHLHVMARFENDTHFPEPMWGEKQREWVPDLPDFDGFAAELKKKLEKEVS